MTASIFAHVKKKKKKINSQTLEILYINYDSHVLSRTRAIGSFHKKVGILILDEFLGMEARGRVTRSHGDR